MTRKVEEINLAVFREFHRDELVAAYDIANGIYSGFPICCVLSYAKGRRGQQARAELRTRAENKYEKESHYIQCRECFKKRRRVDWKKGRLMDELIIHLRKRDRT